MLDRSWYASVCLALVAMVSLPATVMAQDGLRVSATLSATSVAVGENVTYQLVIETGGSAPEFENPEFPPGLTVVGTRDYTSMQFSFPGGRSRTLQREFVLLASAPGTYRIPPVRVRADGMERESPALTLEVSGAALAPAPRNLRSAPGDDVLINARLSSDTVYVGQQVTLETEVLVADDVRIRLRRAPEYIPPEPSGFWLHELPRSGARNEILGNRRYEVQTFRRAYFPISPGEYEIAPARVVYEVRGGIFSPSETFEVASDTLRLVVLPVPENGRPSTYTGAVGRFELDASLLPADVFAGEPTTLTVEVRGTGNIRAVPPPTLDSVPDVEFYPPAESADVQVVADEVRGTKRFSWVVVPQRSGTFRLPPIEYSYFDPETREFRTATTQPLTLFARGGGADAPAGAVAMRPARLTNGGWSQLAWVRSPAFLAAQALPLAWLLWLAWQNSARRRPATPGRRATRSRREALVRQMSELANADPSRFLEVALREAPSWLAERLGRPELTTASPAEIGRELTRHGVEQATANAIARLLERVQHARFEPVPPEPGFARTLAAELGRLLEAVDRQAGRSRSTAAICLTVVTAALIGTAPAHAAPASAPHTGPAVGPAAQSADGIGDAFQQALDALERGQAASAADRFLDIVRAEPRDATAWYNLGVACEAAGARGCAVWAWLVALKLRPRDDDAEHNLRVAGVAPEVATRVRPPIPLSDEEMALVGSALWVLGILALAARFRSPNAPRRTGAFTAIVFAGALLLANWGVPQLRRMTVVAVYEGTTLHASPNARAEIVRAVQPGEVFYVLERRGRDWFRVSTVAGEEGWMSATALASVKPVVPENQDPVSR